MQSEKLSYFNGNITIDADICNGKPTIRGQRITVQTILEFLSAGESSQEILKQYPTLTQEDIHTCLVIEKKAIWIKPKPTTTKTTNNHLLSHLWHNRENSFEV